MAKRFDERSYDNFIDFALGEIQDRFGKKVKANRKSILKFGQNGNVGTTETFINFNNIEPRRSSTNDITVVSSSSASDTAEVRVEGMYFDGNNDFIFIAQTVTLNGQSNVTLPQAMCRVTRIARANGDDILGDVYAHTGGATTGGVPNDLTTVGNVLVQAEQSTLYAGTSVASTNYLIISSFHADLTGGTPSGAAADIRLKVAGINNDEFRTLDKVTVSRTNGEDKPFYPFLIIEPNTDVRLTAEGTTTGLTVAASFQGFFADIY